MKLNNKIVEKIINCILNVLIFLIGIVFLISVYTGFQIKILGNDYSDFFGYSMFEVQTGSMANEINAGDWIIVKLTQNVKLNDVITYKYKNDYITHRIIEVYKGTYVTKGDANNAKDEPIDQSQIVGKVVKIMPNLGILRKTIFNPAVLLALTITLFLFSSLFKKDKNSKIEKLFSKFMTKQTSKPVLKEEPKEEIKSESKTLEQYQDICNFDTLKENKFSEEELEKTICYRVIPVDLSEKPQTEVEVDEVKEETVVEDKKYTEEELEKTIFFRAISVDMNEAKETLREIAKNEIKEPKKEIIKEEVKEEPKEELTNIDLELLKGDAGKRKPRNIIDKAILIKEEELEDLIQTINQDDELQVNEASIKERFMNVYIGVKYYNCYNDGNIEKNKKLILKIDKIIKDVVNELINNYKGSDKNYRNKVYKYANVFTLIANLEQANEMVKESKAKQQFYIEEINKFNKNLNSRRIEKIAKDILDIQKKYKDTINYFLQKLDTSTFELEYNELTSDKNTYGLKLNHNISFSKVYSDYIIDKTYNEGIIAEDRMIVLLTLLSARLVKDMTSANFNKKYLFYMTESIYDKEKKFEKMLKMIDDSYAKEKVVIVIKKEDLIENIKLIGAARKEGYKFALVINDINTKVDSNMGLADYIFVTKKDIVKIIPKDLMNRVVCENITNKIEGFGSD